MYFKESKGFFCKKVQIPRDHFIYIGVTSPSVIVLS
jgi:hypothetical protein